MKIFMILGITKELFPLVDIARANGYKVLGTDRNPNSEGLEYVDIPLVLDSLDEQQALKIARKYKVKAVTTRTEMLLPTVSFICDAMGLAGPSLLVSSLSNDKYLFRQFMSESGIAAPVFLQIEGNSTIEEVENKLGRYPFVLKPVDFSGSSGVALIENRSDFAAEKLNSLDRSPTKRAIIESFLEGNEFSVESISQNNKTQIIAITEKSVTGSKRFVEQRHILPAVLSEFDKRRVEKEVIKMAEAMEMNNCIAHTEVMVSPDKVVIIETAARPAGDEICFKLIPLALGINMYQNMFNLATGKTVNNIVTKNLFSGIQFITPKNKNKIILKKKTSNIKFIEFNFKDSLITELDQSANRLGYFINVESCRETLLNKLNFYSE